MRAGLSLRCCCVCRAIQLTPIKSSMRQPITITTARFGECVWVVDKSGSMLAPSRGPAVHSDVWPGNPCPAGCTRRIDL